MLQCSRPLPWLAMLLASGLSFGLGAAAARGQASVPPTAPQATVPMIPLPPDCPLPPAAVRDVDIPRFYGDDAGSVVDARLAALHEKAVAPLTAFVRQVTQSADKAWTRSAPKSQAEAAQCTLVWLEQWARGGAWLGVMSTRQAEYQRKWDLAGVALAYLKVRRFADLEQRVAIEPWLHRYADTAHAFFDDRERQRNNHWYWLGLGVAAVGIATDSPRHWQIARGIFADAMAEITADGTLPKEMERKQRALFYNVFAMTPLVVMAEIAAARGEDWYAGAGQALHRLVALVHAGLMAPEIFDQFVGEPQERPVNARGGWLQLYRARFPDRLTGPHPDVADGHRWLGGAVAVLREALARGF